jgi:hypothetical protein
MFSQTYLIHLPLYGSGFLRLLILDANSQTSCLSTHDICTTFFAFSSNFTVIHAGASTSTL